MIGAGWIGLGSMTMGRCASAALLAQGSARTLFEWGRIRDPADWWLPVLALAIVLGLGVLIYRRDSAELSRPLAWLLALLRMTTYVLLWLIFLQPQWRTHREVTQNSRALLLVDTSLSMELPAETVVSGPPAPSRASRVAEALGDSDLLSRLRRKHDVIVWRFDESTAPLGRWARDRTGRLAALGDGSSRSDHTTKRTAPNASLEGGKAPAAGNPADNAAVADRHVGTDPAAVDWRQALQPRGTETRLGEALERILKDHLAAAPIAGVVLFSDGGQNAGVGPAAAIRLAQDESVPIHVVGLGSDHAPPNVRIRDLMAPARVYPGDSFRIVADVQAEGAFSGTLTAELWSSPSQRSAAGEPPARLEATQTVSLAGQSESTNIVFEITPEQVGTRTYRVVLKAPSGDANPADNQQQAEVEVVDRQTRVLLFAGGPSREYRFLRTQLFRDDQVELHVLLQTAEPGVAQEADELLSTFPDSLGALNRYDALVAIDPDWQALSDQQIEWLEKWVAEQAGGLIVVAGRINTPTWVRSPELAKLRAIYPVRFERSYVLGLETTRDATQPWPVELTRDGLDAEFLRIDDGLSSSLQAWTAFDGVYDCFPVRGAKPGATVYAHFGDPRAGNDEGLLPLMAGQFYGGGRVFYLGTAEMWRLRRLDPAYFERLYVQLIRHVSQGRLLRGSSRGTLLTERQRYGLGQTISVRARLLDDRLQPLEAPHVPLEVIDPQGRLHTVELSAEADQPGSFVGHLVARSEGLYRLELDVPGTVSERLSRRVQVRMPDLERRDPQRNDALLSQIASETGGVYWNNVRAAVDIENGLPAVIKDRSKTMVQIETPQPLWDNTWVLAIVCGLLSIEWLIRRLVRLA